MECENKTDTGNNRGDWDHFKITQTAANTVYPVNMVCFRYIIVNTVHTSNGGGGDDDDDDYDDDDDDDNDNNNNNNSGTLCRSTFTVMPK